jgi:hypothetical protein
MEHRQALVETVPERESFLKRGYDYQEAELAARRLRLRDKVNAGDSRAKGEMTKIKNRQRQLARIREDAIATLHREPELIVPAEVAFLAHALVIPSTDPEQRKRQDQQIETMAMNKAWQFEASQGAVVQNVSTPQLAREAGLTDYPGFDLLSRYSDGQQLSIEVKGRAQIGAVELTENEWVAACNLRERYWLYVVFNCASSHPRLWRVQDPFGKLIVNTKTRIVIDEQAIFQAAQE